MHYVNVIDLQNKIDKALEKGKAILRYTGAVKDSIEELKLCKEISKSPKRLLFENFNVFSVLVDETVNELHSKIKDFFAKKQEEYVEEAVSHYMEVEGNDDERFDGYFVQTPIDDIEDELEGLEALLPADEMWSEELIRKARREVALAQAKRELARRNRKCGAKVKRVPLKKDFDAADVAAELGMEDLAKELTVEYPKPFVNTKKEGPVTKREYFAKTTGDIDVQNNELKELLEKALNKEDDFDDTSKKLKAVLHYEKNKPKEKEKSDYRHSRVPQNEAVSAFYEDKHTENSNNIAVVEHLEKLVGKFTTEKLAAERKLALAELDLKEANENLRKSNVNEILGVPENSSRESVTDKLKRDFEDAFRGRKF